LESELEISVMKQLVAVMKQTHYGLIATTYPFSMLYITLEKVIDSGDVCV
jgi:hypothetical protein